MPICQSCQQNLSSDAPLPESIAPLPEVVAPKPRIRRGGCGRRKHWSERGIYWEASQGRPGAWVVRVRLDGKLNYLGRFESPREAKKVRNRFWAEKLGHLRSGLRR
jgi:hypothetical protein